MNEALQSMFGKHQEQIARVQEAVSEASDVDSHRERLSVSGRYRMRVDTYAYTKTVDSGTEVVVMPNIKESAKGSLLLTFSLSVVDGTDVVPAGANRVANIVLLPAPGANAETIANTAKMMKPRLSALLGHSDICLSDLSWIEQNLLPEFQEKGAMFKLVRDHKMKNEVMVTWEDDVWNNELTLKLKSIAPALPGDKSVSNVASPSGDSQGFGDSQNVGAADDFVDIDMSKASITNVAGIANTEDF